MFNTTTYDGDHVIFETAWVDWKMPINEERSNMVKGLNALMLFSTTM